MHLHDYIKMIHKLKNEKTNADFFRAIIESFIRDQYKHENMDIEEFNPIEKRDYSNDTLKKICNGSTRLSQQCAIELINLYDRDKFMGFLTARTDNFDNIEKIIKNYGFEILIEEGEEDVIATCADLLARIIEDISKGIKETLPPLRKVTLHTLDKDAFKNAYRKDNYIYVSDHCIELPFHIDDNEFKCDEYPYVKELLKVYSERLKKEITCLKDLEEHKKFLSHFNRQKQLFYSAEAMKHSVRDLFTDGEENFHMLENEIWSAVSGVYYDIDINDGYRRIVDVLDMALKAQLNSTILLNIRGLIKADERQGICHILVNDGIIKSWVEVDYE